MDMKMIEGKIARDTGQPRSSNPYSLFLNEKESHIVWDDGWLASDLWWEQWKASICKVDKKC